MSSEYLYLFGYETPAEQAANDNCDTDFESTGFFRILAESEEEAVNWGDELAEWYVKNLSGSENPVSWRAAGYASWIEHEPDEVLTKASELGKAIPVGCFPDFEAVRMAFSD